MEEVNPPRGVRSKPTGIYFLCEESEQDPAHSPFATALSSHFNQRNGPVW